MRARGAWFGNRSISAEVDLDPGLYEVVPKLVARRDADSPDVHEVVTKVAERNPQKLRQIDLAYDIANAKGIIEVSEEEKKRKEAKQKEVSEKKKKEKEAAEKDEADFEARKKDEKAEYEAWKKEKQRLGRQVNPDADEPGNTDSKSNSLDIKDTFASIAEDEMVKLAEGAANSSVTETTTDVSAEAQELKSANALSEADLASKAAGFSVDDAATPSDGDEAEHTPNEGPDNYSRYSSRAVSRGQRLPPQLHRYEPQVYYEDDPTEGVGPGDPLDRLPVDERPKPWNAVCVLGLRVYSQDPEVSIKLLKPKSVEEGAVLDVGGETAAGATM